MKPLIWIESVIERHAHSRVEYMIKARSQFKRRSTANHVEVVVPVPADADSPKFKTSVGSVRYVPEQNVLIWSIKSFPVGSHFFFYFFLFQRLRSIEFLIIFLAQAFQHSVIRYHDPPCFFSSLCVCSIRVVRNTWCGPISVSLVSSVRKRKASHPFKWNSRSPTLPRQAFRWFWSAYGAIYPQSL